MIRSTFYFALLAAATGAASAQPADIPDEAECLTRAQIHARLTGPIGEAIVARGFSQDGSLVILYADPETGSWTIVAVWPNNCADIIDFGEHYEAFDPPTGEPL